MDPMSPRPHNLRRRLAVAVGAAVLLSFALTLAPGTAQAHEERDSRFPAPPGRVPQYRTDGPFLVVCKPDTPERIAAFPPDLRASNEDLFQECQKHGFRNIQEAVDHVTVQGTRILIQPGAYYELPSLAPQTGDCATFGDEDILTYQQQRACPHAQNLIAIFGDATFDHRPCATPWCRLQIEGTGARPTDVIVDGRFKKLNVLRADRADEIYLRNFTLQHAKFNSVYVIETDGFVIDHMLARWNDEYGFLTFSSDHGLYQYCEAHGNGDGGLYPGSAADLHGRRFAVEIHHCFSHHNVLGVSGTAGNSLYVHDNVLTDNGVGISMDSFFPNHPGLPQDSSTYTHNLVFSNNADFYRYWRDGTCDKPSEERGYERGVVCPSVQVPVGTGILVAGGNNNTFRENYIFDNWRYGAMLFYVPAALRQDFLLGDQFDTSHRNRFVGNFIGFAPDGQVLPNGLDVWWDEEGADNCWQLNVSAHGPITSDPRRLPDCQDPRGFRPPDPVKSASLAPCATWTTRNNDPPGCTWTHQPPPPS